MYCLDLKVFSSLKRFLRPSRSRDIGFFFLRKLQTKFYKLVQFSKENQKQWLWKLTNCMLKSILLTKTMRKWQVQVICCAGEKPEIMVHVSLCIASNEIISTDIKLHTTYIRTICHGRYVCSNNRLHYLEPGWHGPELSKLAYYILISWNICKLAVYLSILHVNKVSYHIVLFKAWIQTVARDMKPDLK